jgi:hypothetical protein
MAETSPIAGIAELISKHLFKTFFWETNGIYDQNWPCEDPNGHVPPKKEPSSAGQQNDSLPKKEAPGADKPKKKGAVPKKTHPSDVVFYYNEPYGTTRTYVNCDLKSYAAGSITPGKVLSALKSLAMSLSCAEKSNKWRKLYVHDKVNATIIGLLFIYNHDEAYDKGFDQILASVNHEKLEVPKGSRIVILGPSDIQWLNNVHSEIVFMRGIEELPLPHLCRFHYPNLVRKKNVQETSAATIEMLMGPWIVMKYKKDVDSKENVIVFYRGRGQITDEFLHLIDYLMYHELIDKDVNVKIRTLDPDPAASAIFNKAIADYIEAVKGGPDIEKRLRAIEYKQISKIKMNFSLVELGMKHD